MLNSSASKPSGRRRGNADTRGEILAAAQKLFAERGMAGTSVRGVAARAGVDPSLVLHFFGSKAGLFEAALHPPVSPDEAAGIIDGPRAKIGERAVRFYVERVFGERGDTVATLLRSAVTDEAAAARLRAAIQQGPLSVVTRRAPGGALSIEMFGTMMIGLFVARRILRLEPIASLPDDQLIALYAPLAQALLGRKRR